MLFRASSPELKQKAELTSSSQPKDTHQTLSDSHSHASSSLHTPPINALLRTNGHDDSQNLDGVDPDLGEDVAESGGGVKEEEGKVRSEGREGKRWEEEGGKGVQG